jgi:hypothetical protein
MWSSTLLDELGYLTLKSEQVNAFFKSIGISIRKWCLETIKPLPHEMTVRRLRSENNLYTEALCSYHVAGKMKASCVPQPYALEPMYNGSLMLAVSSFWQKVSDASTPHTLSI